MPILFFQAKFFLNDMSEAQKGFLLGLLYASYPLAQMLSSVIWTKVADRLGRKNMMRLSFLGNMLGYGLSAFGVFHGRVEFLLLGNSIAGLVGVNISTMNALIMDAFEGPRRAKYFGLIQLILGLAFAIGPYVSSNLVQIIPHVETLVFFLFCLASIVALFNSFFIMSLPQEKMELVCYQKNTLDVKKLDKELFRPLILIFCVTIGWYLFIKTFQLFLMQNAAFSAKQVLRFISFSGFSMVLSQGLFVSFFYKKTTGDFALKIAVVGLALSMLTFMVKPPSFLVYINIFILAFFQSLVMPQLLNAFSKNFTSEIHGKVMSAHMGVVSFGKVMAPLISALTLLISPSLSILLGACFVTLGFFLIPKVLKEKQSVLD
jgi:DHA1 family tetracycline resistance protein-like MFS transporter